MGTYKRLPRGKKKPTNELTTFAEKAYAWVHHQWRTVAIVAAGSLVFFVVLIGIYKYVTWRADTAAVALANARSVESVAERRDRLSKVAENYARTSAGREAAALIGNDALAEDDSQDALQWFEFLRDHARSYPILHVYALQKIGKIYEDGEQWQKAADAYRAAAAVKGNMVRAQSLYDEARCLEKLGKYIQARDLYREVVDTSDETETGVKTKSEERLLWLLAHNAIKE